ncbi:MAG: hypothetical protein QM733_22040 [Ilumatobacteraceae bacterium]
MADVQREWSRDEWNRALAAGSAPTADDVSITKDGRRLDTLEKILAWVAELNAEREQERLTTDGVPT